MICMSELEVFVLMIILALAVAYILIDQYQHLQEKK